MEARAIRGGRAAVNELDLRGERVVLGPVAAGDVGALRAIRLRPEVAAWWGELESDFPESDDPEATRFTIHCAGAVAGLIQFGEEPDPMYRHAWIDIFVNPDLGRQGIATDAIHTLVRHLTADLGHHRITIDPALDNVAAVRCYERAGFRRVDVMEAPSATRSAGAGVTR